VSKTAVQIEVCRSGVAAPRAARHAVAVAEDNDSSLDYTTRKEKAE